MRKTEDSFRRFNDVEIMLECSKRSLGRVRRYVDAAQRSRLGFKRQMPAQIGDMR
jgi:hypothetical protein